jgi:hypothetical protein
MRSCNRASVSFRQIYINSGSLMHSVTMWVDHRRWSDGRVQYVRNGNTGKTCDECHVYSKEYIGTKFRHCLRSKTSESNLSKWITLLPFAQPESQVWDSRSRTLSNSYRTAPASSMYPIRSSIMKKQYSRLLIVESSSP